MYNNVFSLCILRSDEPHLGVKTLEVPLRAREERSISSMLPRVARVEVVNE
jgi:hypothetical protein